MNRKEAIRAALACRGHIYTTDELWENDENCILSDSLGNLIYGDGELIDNIEDLPLNGWWDATDIDESEDIDEYKHRMNNDSYIHEDVLWDENDIV